MLFAVIVALGAPAVSMAQVRTPDEQRRRDQIRIMEGVLVQAVRLGAENVSRQLERFEPAGVTVLSGVPRARGFVLEGYGVFFDVEIPDMNQSVIWSMMNIQRDRVVGNALDSLRAEIEAMAQGPNRDRAQDGAAAGHQDCGSGAAAPRRRRARTDRLKVKLRQQPPRCRIRTSCIRSP